MKLQATLNTARNGRGYMLAMSLPLLSKPPDNLITTKQRKLIQLMLSLSIIHYSKYTRLILNASNSLTGYPKFQRIYEAAIKLTMPAFISCVCLK